VDDLQNTNTNSHLIAIGAAELLKVHQRRRQRNKKGTEQNLDNE
jgi:hypothetical protein